MFEKWASRVRGGSGAGDAPPGPGNSRKAGTLAQPMPRRSQGLEEFFGRIQDESGLRILDLGGACQANVSFITNLGHRLSSEDMLQSMDQTFPSGLPEDEQAEAGEVELFLHQNLGFPCGFFDGVLAWDVLEYLPPQMLSRAVDRIADILRPGSYLFALFHAEERTAVVPSYYYRIASANNLLLAQRALRPRVQSFNNRALEKLFQPFASVKFFLTRDSLREVIVKR